MQKSEVEADTVDVSEYLSLKLLGRDAKVRVSDVFDATKWAGNSSLFAVSNRVGWFVAGTPTGLVASPLAHMRELQASATGDGPAQLEAKRHVQLSGAPYFIHFATSHTKVVVVVRADDDWALEIFNAEDICKEGSGDVKPVHTFSLGQEDVIDVQPNPNDGSELVAILRGRKSSSSYLDIINITTASRAASWGAADAMDEGTALTCISWSVRGKQIVVGTRGGELAQFTPEGERKQTVPPPPSHSSSQAVVSVLWLENSIFHVVYGNPTSDPSDPTHEYEVLNIIFDSKANTASYIKFTDPAPPYGVASRLACRHYARLVGWEPAKHLIFVADGPSTDVGMIACLSPSEAEGKLTPWATLEVDETSRISLPMDEDFNDTSVMGIDLDLTSTEPISNSQEAGDDAAPSPPSPILHLYTSAGLVISYHVLNARGGKYPGMGATNVPSAVSPPARPTTPPAPITTTKPSGFASFGAGTGAFGSSSFGQTPAKPAFGSSTFGSTTPSGAPAFGVSAFGASTTPTKPIPFGQASTTPAGAPAFGQTATFGSSSAFGGGFGKFAPSTTPTTAPSASGGFSGFGSKPATFGTSGGTNIFSGSESAAPKPEGGSSVFGSSAFGTSAKPNGGFAGFGSSAATAKIEIKPREAGIAVESAPTSATAKTPLENADEDLSPPGSPAAQSDSGLDLDNIDLGGTKKPPAGLNLSDDEEHDPTETPSKPPAASAFSGFGKPSAFGTTSSGGAFAAASPTSGVVKPAAGFGAFGAKSSAPSTGFSFGGAPSQTQGEKSGEPAKPAFAGGSSFGSTTAFGSTSVFGSTTAFGSTSAFGTTSKPGSGFGTPSTFGTTSAPGFGAPSGFGTAAKPTTSSPAESTAPKAGGFASFAAKPGESKGPTGFAGFGDGNKNKVAGDVPAFAAKPVDTKIGFAGFGQNTDKKTASDEKPNDQAKPQESAEPEKVEAKEDKPPTPKQETEKPKQDTKLENNAGAPPKSAFGLLVSSPPPKPKEPIPPSETPKPLGEVPSKIPIPKAPSLLDRLSPRPEPQEPNEANASGEPSSTKSQSVTPPGSPARPPSPPAAAPPKSITAPVPSHFGSGKSPKPFGSTPLRSSPLASPPVTRGDDAKQEEFAKVAPVNPPALVPKVPSSPFAVPEATKAADSIIKPASTGFFGFGKPATVPSKEAKPKQEQWPGSFSGEMKGASVASITAGSPSITAAPATASPENAPANLTTKPNPLFSVPAPTALGPTASGAVPPVSSVPSSTKPSLFSVPVPGSSGSPFTGVGFKPVSSSPLSAPSTSPAPPSLFSPLAPTAPSTSASPAPTPSFGFASFKPITPAAPAPSAPPPFSTSAPPPLASASSAPPELWSNVEVEFNKLLEQMSNELGKLRQDTVALQQRHLQMSRTGIPSPATIQSIENATRWGLGDLNSLKQVTTVVSKEIDQLKGLNKNFAAQMTELQPGIEKVQAKRNEIARYIKAKKDPKYTRLLKSRTSSPEHIESQVKLRKSLQMVRDRTRQLEDFMATQRSRIHRQKEGKKEFKVPSLDTINRTMRNIDSALAQKSEEISALTARVDRMKLKATKRKTSTNGVAPLALPPAENEKIKLSSAAALNMERSSIRLKNALLQARKETPLNTTAVGAPVESRVAALSKSLPARPPVPATPSTPSVSHAPPVFSTPAPSLPAFGQPTTPNPLAPKTSTPGGFVLPVATPAAIIPNFSPLGKDEFHITSAYEHSSRRSEKSRMHGSSAKLKTPSPNISRTTVGDDSIAPLPAPALPPTITPAKSFFGGAPTPSPLTGARPPGGFFSFSSPGGPVASTPPPVPKGFSFFQTPAQKATTTAVTPPIPPLPKWASPSPSTSTNGETPARKGKPTKDDDGGSEGRSGDEDEDDEDEDDDEDWLPGEDDEDEDEDEDDEDEDDVSDGVPEGDDEDQTARI